MLCCAGRAGQKLLDWQPAQEIPPLHCIVLDCTVQYCTALQYCTVLPRAADHPPEGGCSSGLSMLLRFTTTWGLSPSSRRASTPTGRGGGRRLDPKLPSEAALGPEGPAAAAGAASWWDPGGSSSSPPPRLPELLPSGARAGSTRGGGGAPGVPARGVAGAGERENMRWLELPARGVARLPLALREGVVMPGRGTAPMARPASAEPRRRPSFPPASPPPPPQLLPPCPLPLLLLLLASAMACSCCWKVFTPTAALCCCCCRAVLLLLLSSATWRSAPPPLLPLLPAAAAAAAANADPPRLLPCVLPSKYALAAAVSSCSVLGRRCRPPGVPAAAPLPPPLRTDASAAAASPAAAAARGPLPLPRRLRERLDTRSISLRHRGEREERGGGGVCTEGKGKLGIGGEGA